MGFKPERLRDIRILNEFTVEEVAGYVGITKQSVSKYENGTAIPSVDVLERIIELFSIPSGYLNKEKAIIPDESIVFYRKTKRTTQKELDVLNVYFKWYYELILTSKEFIDFNNLKLPFFEGELSIEEKAKVLRKFWDLGEWPVKDMVSLLEQKGFYIFTVSMKNSKIDGAFQYKGGIPIIILNDIKGSRERKNFSLAHELGHMVLHSQNQHMDEEQMEREADLFASSFLMPRDEFLKEIIRIDADSLVMYGKKWGVSPHAVLERCNHLDLLERNQERRNAYMKYMYTQLNKKEKYYVAEERKICSLQETIKKIESDKEMGREFLRKLCFPIKEIQRLCQMPGIFDEYNELNIRQDIQYMDGVQLSFIF